MADRERNDLRRVIEATRHVLEAHERRRTLLRRRERPTGVRRVGAAFGSGARWVREHPVRLVVTAVVLLGMASLAYPSMTGEETRLPRVAALPDHGSDASATGEPDPAAPVTARLSIAGADRDEQPGAESGEPSAEPDDAPGEGTSGAPAADPEVAASPPPRDRTPQDTTDKTSEPTPELSGTSEPEPAESPEPEPTETSEPGSPDDTADASDGTCLGVDALGLTVDLCIPSLLEG